MTVGDKVLAMLMAGLAKVSMLTRETKMVNILPVKHRHVRTVSLMMVHTLLQLLTTPAAKQQNSPLISD